MDENEKRTEFTDDRPITEEPSKELGNLAAQINEQDKSFVFSRKTVP